MAFYDKFPYTNFQELNLDKIVQKIGDIDRAEEATAESAAQAASSATQAANSAIASAESATASAESATASAGSATNAAQTAARFQEAEEQININTERIDNIIASGTPTEGNTELLDIRVGGDGVTHETAGTAVRSQYLELKDGLLNIPASAIKTEASELSGVITENYAYDIGGPAVPGTLYCYGNYDVTSVKGIITVTGASWGPTYPLLSFYKNNTLLKVEGITGDSRYEDKLYIIPEECTKIILNGSTDQNGKYRPKIVIYSGFNQAFQNIAKVQPYGTDIRAALINANPDMASLRNWRPNHIYNLGDDAYPLINELPEDFTTYGSLVKFTGYWRSDLASTWRGYCSYFLVGADSAWFGFDTGGGIVWHSLTPTAGKTYLFIGDSYAQGYSHDGLNDGWVQYMINYLNIPEARYTKSLNGGASFCNTNNSFLTRLNNAAVKDYTDIIVAGGFNDFPYTQSEIETAIATFCARAKTLYPSAKIHIGCIGWIKQGSTADAYSNWADIRNQIETRVIPAYQNATRYGAGYMNNTEFLLNDNGLTPSDGYHPSAEGNQAIATGIANAVLTGSAPLPYRRSYRQ